MYLVIGDVTINNVTDCRVERDDKSGRNYLLIVLPKTAIEHDELFDLLDANESDIVCYAGEDDTTGTALCGYHKNAIVTTTATEYECKILCTSEVDQKVIELQNALAAQAETIATLSEENQMLTDCLLEMSGVLYE